MAIKTIFLDRDGVINKEVNYLYKINDFQFIEGIFDACSYLEKLGYKIIIITNQAGIAKNFYSIKEVAKMFNTKIKVIKARPGERFASALTKISKNSKIIKRYGKIHLKDYITSVIKG